MVAFNFSTDFVPVLQSGHKTRTIRPVGKKQTAKAKVGDDLQLFINMRYAGCKDFAKCNKDCSTIEACKVKCRKVAEAKCIGVAGIVIGNNLLTTDSHPYRLSDIQGDVPITKGNRDFYQLDGFHGRSDFMEFFEWQAVRQAPPSRDGKWRFNGFIYVWEVLTIYNLETGEAKPFIQEQA